METLLKADIFFFIASVATIEFIIFFAIFVFYLIKITRNLYFLSESLKTNLKDTDEYARELKERLDDNILFRFIFPRSRKKRIKNETK